MEAKIGDVVTIKLNYLNECYSLYTGVITNIVDNKIVVHSGEVYFFVTEDSIIKNLTQAYAHPTVV